VISNGEADRASAGLHDALVRTLPDAYEHVSCI
jgi:hypothetical protein